MLLLSPDMKITPTITLLLAAGVVLTTAPAPPLQAQGQSAAQGRPEVSAAVRHDTSIPLREMTPKPVVSTRASFEVKMPPMPALGPVTDQAVQRFYTSALAAIPGIAFDGVGEGNPEFPGFNVNVAPPDTTGDVSPTQYVQWVNLSFAVFDKATSPGTLLNPFRLAGLGNSTTTALTIDDGDGPISLLQFALTMRAVAGGGGRQVTVPVADPNFSTPAGSAVRWDRDEALALFRSLEEN